jgi:CHAD domain-containing protein
MSTPRYRIRTKERKKPAAGMRRVIAGRAECAVERLDSEAEKELAPAVHETRKDLKKLRSALRLVRDEIGDGAYRAENDRYRDAGRLLSGPRDAEVKLETLEGLFERNPEDLDRERYARFSEALREERDAAAETNGKVGRALEQAIAEISAGREEVEELPLASNSWKLVRGGLERSYRRGRRAYRSCAADPSDEAVHEWRKRVKDLWYQQRILRKAWDGPVGASADESHELSDLLGDHHDLAVLAADARDRAELFDLPSELDALLAAARKRQDELLADALDLGARVYAEKPKAFLRRHRAYWKAWRG